MNQTPSDSSSDEMGQPIEANLVEDQVAEDGRDDKEITMAVIDPNHAEIRIGSPFAVDPPSDRAAAVTHKGAQAAGLPTESILDVGPMRYTAMGAVAASTMVVGFGAAAMWWFPAGGTVIAALGCTLSIFGMFSNFRLTAASLLALHLCLFLASYGRAL